MKRYFKKFFSTIFITLLTITITILQSPMNIFSFGNVSHQQLSEHAFYDALRDLGLSDYFEQSKPIIFAYCTNPDRKEAGSFWLMNSYRKHFFNVETDSLSGDNAYSSMLYHYNCSIECAANDEWTLSLQELAQAMHYLQDMCCPVHIWGYGFNTLRVDLHMLKEAEWDAMWNSDKISRYILTVNRRVNPYLVRRNFSSPEDLGLCFSRAALDKHGEWIADRKSVFENILPFVNLFNPLVHAKKFTKDPYADTKEDSDEGFREGWKTIFDLPYLASYKLVFMWVNEVRSHNPPPPDRGACILQ